MTQPSKSFKIPASVSKNAQRGLDLHNKFNKGGTDVGLKRAQQLIDGRELSEEDIKSMYSYFKRHTVDKQSKDFGDDQNPSKGYIAWLMWGGDEGEKLVNKIHEEQGL
jgi:hypothetical protein